MKFLKMFLSLFANDLGIVTLDAPNYAGAYSTEPIAKYPPGEQAGTPKVLIERFIVKNAAGTGPVLINSQVNVGKLPAGSFVVDAYLKGSKAMTSGIFTLGHEASVDEDGTVVAENLAGFVPATDCGDGAIMVRSTAACPSLNKRFGQETILKLNCTEASDVGILDGVLEVYVSYVNK